MQQMALAQQILSDRFGFESFRPGQRIIIEAVLAGRDVLAIMPTGAGKSLCYQLPALVFPGVTLVVSPLIALMKDQVDALQRRGIPATFVNSSISLSEQEQRLLALRSGTLRLLYVAPERFRNRAFLRAMESVRLSLLAIDEAHCISQWGHDFRPDYLRLRQAIENLRPDRVLALTATANAKVQIDIVQQIPRPAIQKFVGGFDRPNLHFAVDRLSKKAEKLERLLELVRRLETGIVYTATRKAAEEATQFLTSQGVSALCYHGGLEAGDRRRIQDLFMGWGKSTAEGQEDVQDGMPRDGAKPPAVVCATNAFGMGIDKADIRFVIHYQMPGTLEAYYQEAGRAGRDGAPSECHLLYSAVDVRIQKFFIEGENPPREAVEALYAVLVAEARRHPEAIVQKTQDQLAEDVPEFPNSMGVSTALKLLESAGHLLRLSRSTHTATFVLERPHAHITERAKVQRKILQSLKKLASATGIVEISLEALALYTGLNDASLRRGIHALENAQLIEYQPPFQGRGVRLTEPVPPEKLNIDWAAQEQKAAHAYEKLEIMRQYVFSRACRRAYLLRYFGEKSVAGNCQNCDVCGTGSQRRGASGSIGARQTSLKRVPTEGSAPLPPGSPREDKIIVLKVLSCAARLRNRYDRQTLQEVLRGERSLAVLEAGLHRSIKTYGQLIELPAERVSAWIERLLEVDALRQDSNHCETGTLRGGRMHLTSQGMRLIRQREHPATIFPRLPEHHPTFSATEPYDAPLFAKLRMALARHLEERDLDQQRALSDSVLQQISRIYPMTVRKLRGDAGLTPEQRRLWQPLIFEVVGRHLGEQGVASAPEDKEQTRKRRAGGSRKNLAATENLSDEDYQLFEAIKEWRLKVSKKRRLRAFQVLTDSDIFELCRTRPRTHAELRAVHGFGPKKVQRYGDLLLDLILRHKPR